MTWCTVSELPFLRARHVQADECYGDAADGADASVVFVVVDDHRYLGLVAEHHAVRAPATRFGDLVVLHPVVPLPSSADLDQALDYLAKTREEYIPLVDGESRFLGVVSRASLFASLGSEIGAVLRHHAIAATVFDNTSDGIVVTDAFANIVLVNRAFTQTTGYTLEDVRGGKPSLLSSGHHDRDFYQSMWQSLNEAGAWSGEIWNRRKNGEIYPEWLRVNAVRNERGEVTNYVGIFADISSQHHLQRQLHQLAYYDALTGLPNRQLFYDRIGQAIVHAKRDNTGFAVLFIDFDRFKLVNDTFGHSFGDKLLQAMAFRLGQVVRESDTVSRLGGDEFTVLLTEASSERDVAAIASKVVQSGESAIEVEGRKIFVTLSVGIARYPNDGGDIDTLLKNADAAMYRAKQEGRNRYCFCTGELNVQVSERLSLESALRSGLRSGALRMVWQPQVRLDDGKMVGLEALARWHHPQQGQVDPTRFIRLAEESGLMPEFGSWMLDTVAEAAAGLARVFRQRPMRLGINISASQLFDGDVLKRDILQALERSGLRLDCFELELSEATLMGRGRSFKATLRSLQDLGLKIVVDDFGTGFSKLSCLTQLDVQRVKIDVRLIRGLTVDDVGRKLVAAIISMAHSLDICVTAEGVETEEQRNILLDLGCDEGQGHLFAEPMELAALVERFLV